MGLNAMMVKEVPSPCCGQWVWTESRPGCWHEESGQDPALPWAPAILGPMCCRSHVASHIALGSFLSDASNHEQDSGQEGHTGLCL